jgi:hypothetical protein
LTFQEYGAYIQSTYLQDQRGIGVGPLFGSARDPDDISTRHMPRLTAPQLGGTPITERRTRRPLRSSARSDLQERIKEREIQR